MPDYITRAEFEAAIEMLQCRGDDQTIQVDHTPGGQTIRSTQVLTEEASTESTADYVSVSYDSGTSQFTITVTDLKILRIFNRGITETATGWANFTTLSQTFVFDLPLSNKSCFIQARSKHSNSSDTELYWYSSGLTASDTATADLEEENNAYGVRVAYVILKSDGTYNISSQPTAGDVIPITDFITEPSLTVNPSTRKIRIQRVPSPFLNSASDKELSYTEPVDDKIILGWSNGNTDYTLDLLANQSSYDTYKIVGRVKVTSGNVTSRCELYNWGTLSVGTTMGYTGTFTNQAGDNLSIVNGLITNIT